MEKLLHHFWIFTEYDHYHEQKRSLKLSFKVIKMEQKAIISKCRHPSNGEMNKIWIFDQQIEAIFSIFLVLHLTWKSKEYRKSWSVFPNVVGFGSIANWNSNHVQGFLRWIQSSFLPQIPRISAMSLNSCTHSLGFVLIFPPIMYSFKCKI